LEGGITWTALVVGHTRCSLEVDTFCMACSDERTVFLLSHFGLAGLPHRPVPRDHLDSSPTWSVYLAPTSTQSSLHLRTPSHTFHLNTLATSAPHTSSAKCTVSTSTHLPPFLPPTSTNMSSLSTHTWRYTPYIYFQCNNTKMQTN
jgi:hypothetical protein